MIDRILQIIDYKGINKSIFYKETGLSNGFLDKVKDIGASKLELILNSYPEIDMEWLLTGKGEMLKSQKVDQNILKEPGESYRTDYKELYFNAKYTIEVQKELIESFRNELILMKELNTKSRAG